MAPGALCPVWSMTALALGCTACQIFLGGSWSLVALFIWRPELPLQTVPTCNENLPADNTTFRPEGQKDPFQKKQVMMTVPLPKLCLGSENYMTQNWMLKPFFIGRNHS